MLKIKESIKKYLPTTLIIVALILIYKVISDKAFLDPYLFPKMDRIINSFRQNGVTMFKNMFSSFRLLFPSILLALAIALGIGVILGLNRRLREITLPVVYAFSVVPAILLSPFAIIMANSFYTASIFMIVYSTIWPTIFATINGIVTIDKTYLDTAESLEITGIRKLTKVILPAAMPSILSGYVTSLRGSFTILVFAEMYGAKYGMGYFVKKFADFGLYENVWSGFIFMVVVLVIILRIFEAVKDRLLSWTID